MFTTLFGMHTERGPTAPKEGDLYKIIECHGRIFEIRYGFYEERDRINGFVEPMEIYPDFIRQPQHTDNGVPFATAIQTPCSHFSGNRNENSTCEECAFYQHCEELLGICTCPENRKT